MNARTVCCLFLTVIMAVASGCSPKQEQQEYITIGALLPLTGEDSDEGLRALNGLQLAKEEINQNGGVLGKKLDIIVLNDRGDEEYIVQQYNTLIKKGVIAIIGSSYSGVTLALAKESEKEGLPVISPTASNPEVTLGRRNVFRAIFIDDYQAEVMAQFARGSLNAQTAVVMRNETSSSFKRASGVFTKSFIDRGGQIMAIESYSDGDDFAGILVKYTAAPPDVVFCPEDFVPASKLVNTAYEIGLGSTYILG
jgi:branched-chain amino acid transport system substrate-binding protein